MDIAYMYIGATDIGKGLAPMPSCGYVNMYLIRGHSTTPTTPSTRSDFNLSTRLAASSWSCSFTYDLAYTQTAIHSGLFSSNRSFSCSIDFDLLLVAAASKDESPLRLSKGNKEHWLESHRHHNNTSTEFMTRLKDSGPNMVKRYVLLL